MARVSNRKITSMDPSLDFLQNIISPQQEMLAYETLWALQSSKEKFLKESMLTKMFVHYTPSEALQEVSSQLNLFSTKTSDDIKKEVQDFFKVAFHNKFNTFSIVVNKGFQYPEDLKSQYPLGLFYYKGNLDILGTKCISIVGSRKASDKGLKQTKILSQELSDEGWTIVSGLALGVDTVAHQSAIDNQKQTIGVIGTPIHEYYPKQNKALQDRIAKDFLLISQVPFYKYAHEPFKHRAYHFPRRNKTMASISKATVIVEAGETSGSLVQAMECLKQKKQLFIMDFCFDNPKIKWPRQYEKQGALRIKSTSDILDYIKRDS